MTMMKKILGGGAAVAALAMAAPASAQYPYPSYNPYAQYNPYAAPQYNPYAAYNPYAYNQTAMMTQVAAQRCSAAVQQRLSSRVGLESVIAGFMGLSTAQPRVLSITQVNPLRSTVRVRGLASSGRVAYSPYGVGLYGSVAAAYQPDLSFRCDVDYRGFVRNIDIDRR